MLFRIVKSTRKLIVNTIYTAVSEWRKIIKTEKKEERKGGKTEKIPKVSCQFSQTKFYFI